MSQPSCWAERLLGQRVGDRYDVERVLGVGGMGAVLAARHACTGRRVALKVVPSDDAASTARLAVEARTAGVIEHPSVADVFDFGRDDAAGVTYLAQRLLRGKDLRDRLADGGPMSPREAVELLAPVMGALVEVHRNRIIHRDIKLENLFLTRDRDGTPRVVLLDFGIAKVLGADDGLTGVGNMVGSPCTMSPEQAYGLPVGPQSDVWAVGVVLFELVTGASPFRGADVYAILRSVTDGPIPRVDDLCPQAGTMFADVVARAMTRHLPDRYRSMASFLEALLECPLSDDAAEQIDGPEVRRESSEFDEGPAAWPPVDRPTVRVPLRSVAYAAEGAS